MAARESAKDKTSSQKMTAFRGALQKVAMLKVAMLPKVAMPWTSKQMKNAVQIALSTPSLSTLVKLLKAADLVETVQKLKHATIFAPTNAAFAKISPEVVESLLRPENKHTLKSILLTHVVGQELFVSDIGHGVSALAVSGAHLSLHLFMHTAFISAPKSTAKVVSPDITAAGGVVIHVIDNVLMP